MDTHTALLSAWRVLVERAGLIDAEKLGHRLIGRYAEPHRAYHTLEHLQQITSLLGELGADDRLQLAAWFHDAVYEPGRSDNEAHSADFARQSLQRCGYPAAAIDFIADAIVATASHRSARAEFDLLMDADLAILGASAADYERYRRGVRSEYAATPQPLFNAGRAAFLRQLLAQPHIFRGAGCRQRFEAQARRNIEDELKQLATNAKEGTP